MPYATIPDGVRLYYEERGKGEPLILISGQGSDHTGWDMVRYDFARNYRTISFDHRGTGLSSKPTEPPYTTRGFAADVIALLDVLEIERAHFYGVSMGGRIGQWLGIDYPERVGSLILGCTTPGNAHGVARPPEINAAFQNRTNDPEGAMLALLEAMYTPGFIANNPEMVEYLKKGPPNPTPDFALRLHYQASEGHDTWERLPEIKAPTLVIHGSDDEVNPTANAKLLADRINGAELYIVEKGRHGYFIEFREEASRVVKDFLARHPLEG